MRAEIGRWLIPAGVALTGAAWLGIGLVGCRSTPEMPGTAMDQAGEGIGVAFTAKPTATPVGKEIRIDFAVNGETDVAVAIRNAEGRVVRHLAAGALGPNAPEPLKKGALGQSLLWDGLDDDGRPVPAGRCTVEVGLGLTATFDKVFGWNPYAVGGVHGLGVAPNGELYVMGTEGRDCMDGIFRVFDADGNYRRTIMPRPADIPLDRARPLGELVLDGGERFPTVLLPFYVGRSLQTPIVTPEGDLILVNGRSSGHLEGKRFRSRNHQEEIPRRLLRIASDGGAPAAGVLGPLLGPGFDKAAVVYLAQGPDGLIYMAGARHAVFRVKWGENETPAPFVGKPDRAGDGAEGLKEPCGIAFDAAGNLYVADRGNHRVAVFDPRGKFAGEIPVEWPRDLLVNRGNGAVYVTSGAKLFTLLKFEGLGSRAPAARFPLNASMPALALDTRGKRPAIYVGNVCEAGPVSDWRDMAILRLTDRGSEFRLEGTVGEYGRPLQPLVLGVDREREWVYGNWPYEGYWRLDGHSGRLETFRIPLDPKANGISEISAGADGTVLVHVTGELGRLDRRLRPLPFSATGTFVAAAREDCLRSMYAKDCTVAPNGDIYWIHERGGYSRPFRVSSLNADGSVKKDSIVVLDSASAAGIRVDRQGNIYLLEHLKPVGKPVPDAFTDRVPVNARETHVEHYGSVLKFGPGGGAVKKVTKGAPAAPGEVRFMVGTGQAVFDAQGLLWSYYGVSMLRSWHVGGGCKCWTPRFDLDDYARVFVPDQLRSRILVLDSNGNLLLTFGRYGNADDRGPGVPLADPRTVMVSREAAYVGDMSNQRVVRCRLGYRRVASCPVEVAGRALADLSLAYGEQGRLDRRRDAIRLKNAESRVEEVRAEAIALSPSLRKRLDWDRLVLPVMRQAANGLSHANDARAVVAVAAPREAEGWSGREARALLGKYQTDGDEFLRLAVAWGLWGGALGNAGKDLLLRALQDPSEKVRVVAAYSLLDRDDPAGLAEIFRGAASKDPMVFKMAETAILRKAMGNDPAHPMAHQVDARSAFVPRYPIGQAEVAALIPLLDQKSWYLDRAVLIMLASSGRPEAAEAIRSRLGTYQERNLNRALLALGVLRARAAVPDMLKFLARGRAAHYGTDSYNGDEAEKAAATALVRVADPASVDGIIALLNSDKINTAPEALRCLTAMFDPSTAPDRRLVPRAGRDNLEPVRLDQLPPPKEIRAAWEAFWKDNKGRYAWSETGGPLRPKQIDARREPAGGAGMNAQTVVTMGRAGILVAGVSPDTVPGVEPAGAVDWRGFDGRTSTFLARLKEAGVPVYRLVDVADLRVPKLAKGTAAKAAVEALAKASGLTLDWVGDRPLLWRADTDSPRLELKTPEDVRRAGWSGDRVKLTAILDASAGGDASRKRACAEAVLRFGRAAGVALLDRAKTEALVRLALTDEDWLLRRQAVLAAVDLKLADAAEIVEKAAGDKHGEVIRAAALAAGRLGGDKGAEILERILGRKDIDDPDKGKIPYAVCYGCAELGTARAVKILEGLVGEAHPYAAAWAARAAGYIRQPEALEFLRKMAENKDPRFQRGAAIGLGTCRAEGVVPLLATLLLSKVNKEGAYVQPWGAAAIALGRQGGDEAVKALIEAWTKVGPREEIVYGLGLAGGPEAGRFLNGLLNHEKEVVRRAAAWALGQEEPSGDFALRAGDLAARVRAERPRIFMRKDSSGGWAGPALPQLRENFLRPDYQQAKRKDKLPGTYLGQVLLWMLTGDELAGLDATAWTCEMVNQGINRARGETPSYAGISVERSAAAYDWLHGHGDVDPVSRRLVMHHLERWMNGFYNDWLKAKQATVFYSRRWGAAAGAGVTALALMGDSPLAAEPAAHILRQLHDPDGLYSIREAQDGGTAGSCYGMHHLFTDTANMVAAVQSATDWDAAGFIRNNRGDWLQKQLYFQMHCTYPDGTFLKDGDLWAGANERDQYRMQVDVIMSLYQSGVARSWADQMEKRWPKYFPSDYHTDFVWQFFVFNDPSVKPAPLSSVPPCMLFSPAIDGYALWRSSWAPDATIVHFHAGDSLDMHGHADQGKFVVFKRKPLADKTGAYNNYGSPLHNHFKSARSANVVIFDDGKNGGRQPGYCNQAGGVASFKEFQAARAALGAPPPGRIVKHEVTPTYARAVACLDGATPDKGLRNKWRRELVFLNDEYILVLDRVALAPGVRCHWQLNFDKEPRAEDGSIRYDDAPARLFCRTLLPEKPTANIVPYVWPVKDQEKTQYTVEVTGPDPSAAEQVFLHVLWPTDTKSEAMPAAAVERRGRDLAVKVGDREYTFRPDEAAND